MLAMNLPRNLISDSTLVDEVFALLQTKGGHADFTDIALSIFRMPHAHTELAAAMVSDLIENDPRFVVASDGLRIADEENRSTILGELEFVVLDVEAVHGRGIPARIIELGAYRVRDGAILDEFQTLINPEASLPRFLANLTGITAEMLRTAPKFADIQRAWLEFIGDAVLVAHNANFDLPLLNREIARVFPGRRLRNAELCTVDLARRLVPQVESYKLDSLAAYFNIEIPRRHRAPDDALATARVFLRLLEALSENRIVTLSEARSFQMKLAPGELQLAFDA
jgi:DNA polymerase III subunit epsilon